MELTNFFIPIQILIPSIISFFLLILIIAKRKTLYKSKKWFWISATVFLCVYLFILVSTVYLSYHYKFELQKFDLDGNGSFSIDERTPEQQRAMRKVIGDTARNLSFISGLIFAFLVALLTYIIGKIIDFFRRKYP